MTQALERLTVIDLSQVMAGPSCCQLLGDLGARVVKVEPVGSGDHARQSMGHRMPGGESSAFLAVNRNKEGIAIDLKQDAGRGRVLPARAGGRRPGRELPARRDPPAGRRLRDA